MKPFIALVVLFSTLVYCVPTLAENDSPSNDQQQIVDAAEPLWGKAVDGLQAGLVIGVHKDMDAMRRFVGYKRLPDLIECVCVGEEVMAEIVVRNVSDHEITFAKTGGQFPPATATDPEGKTQQLDAFQPAKQVFLDRRTLAAGQQCTFNAVHFHLVRGEYDSTHRTSAPLRVKHNVPYRVIYDFTVQPHGKLWSGTLRTGELTVVNPNREPKKKSLGVAFVPEPKPASPKGKRTVLWGEATDGFQAGILVAGTHTVQRRQIELGQECGSQIVVRNVSDASKTIRWRQNQWRRGGWTVIDAAGETTRAHDSWQRSWELRNKDDLITIPPGREIVFYGDSFAVTEHDGRDWVVPSAATGVGTYDARFGIGLRLDTKPEQFVYVSSGNLPIRVTERTPHRLVGRRAENFQITTANGERYELAQSRDKEVVVRSCYGVSATTVRTKESARFLGSNTN